MKKALIVIAVVAVLGLLGEVASGHNDGAPLGRPVNNSSRSGMMSSSSGAHSMMNYKDGTFTGNTIETDYGPVQVSAVISGGKITDINYLQMPSGQGHTDEVTRYVEPYLKESALGKQNAADVEFISGATSTSMGFQESLQSALDQAASGSAATNSGA